MSRSSRSTLDEPVGTGWVAITRRLEGPVDLVAVAGQDGHLWARRGQGFAGRGVALVVDLPTADPAGSARRVTTALGAIARRSIPPIGTGPAGGPTSQPDAPRGPVALGALPFDPAGPARLVIPAVLVEQPAEGPAWVTWVRPAADGGGCGDEGDGGADDPIAAWGDGPVPAEDLMAALGADAPAPPAPTRFEVRSPRSPEDWCHDLVAARDELRSGVADKVVLARELQIDTDHPIPRQPLLEQLRRAYPDAMLFSLDGFVGASPELLVERDGDAVRSHPMAGTAPRSGDPEADAALAQALVASAKDQVEHRHTIDMVHETLLPWCSYLDEEAAPSVVVMANVQHLATLVEGRLSDPPASVVELMRALHPTPAVSGAPRSVALELIARHEGFDRGRYGGPVGWVDSQGNGAWTVGIRSAELDGRRARVFAGVGVVPDSDPAAELAETRAKFEALLNALIRP